MRNHQPKQTKGEFMLNNCCFEHIKELFNYDNNILHMMKSCARQIVIQSHFVFYVHTKVQVFSRQETLRNPKSYQLTKPTVTE